MQQCEICNEKMSQDDNDSSPRLLQAQWALRGDICSKCLEDW
jgi:hypothetical protein